MGAYDSSKRCQETEYELGDVCVCFFSIVLGEFSALQNTEKIRPACSRYSLIWAFNFSLYHQLTSYGEQNDTAHWWYLCIDLQNAYPVHTVLGSVTSRPARIITVAPRRWDAWDVLTRHKIENSARD